MFRLEKKIVKTLIRDHVYYPERLITDTLNIIARFGVVLILYWYVFKLNGGTINNTTFQLTAWSMFFYFSFMIFRLRDVSRFIMQDVKSGNVEVLFSKPISYLSYRFWWQIGAGLYSFVLISVVGFIALYLIVGLPATMMIPIFIPSLILTFLFSVLISLFLYSIIGLLAFWVEDVNPIFWLVDKAVMILGGSYLPIALFPVIMYKLAVFSPFGASQFMTHTVYENWSQLWLNRISIQLFWVIITGLIVWLVFVKVRKRVSINGG